MDYGLWTKRKAQRHKVGMKRIHKKDINIKQILGAIVEAYIETNTPVSSEYIVNAYNLEICSSTVRNYISFLRDNGFITRTYHSSGAVPTSKAYRYYIDCIMETEYLNLKEKQDITDYIEEGSNTLEDIVKHALSILSSVTSQMSFTYLQIKDYVQIKRIEMIPVTSKNILIVFITNTGSIHTFCIKTDVDFSEGALHHISGVITKQLVDIPMQNIGGFVFNKILLGESVFSIFREAFEFFENCIKNIRPQIFWEGASFLTTQPEFVMHTVSPVILKMFENQQIEDIAKVIENQKSCVYIGDNIDTDPISQCGIIASKYTAKKGMSGVLGVLGPRRMPYRKIVPVVSYIAEQLEHRINFCLS
jgi:heat-inducible transcriptional repressor